MRIIFRRWVLLSILLMRVPFLMMAIRRQLYGEDNLSATNNDHILHLGPGRAARIREHASTRLQRCRCHPIHVRPLPKVDAQLGEGVVSPSAGLQQGAFNLTSLSCKTNRERHRLQSHFSSVPSLTPLRRFREMSKRRSRNRPSASPKRCTRLSSFARHPRPSTCKRSSKSCSQRHLTSNASFLRSKESASLYCSTLMCECTTGRTDRLVSSAHRICAGCTIHTHLYPDSMPRRFVLGFSGTRLCRLLLRCYLTCLRLRALYISYFVRSCIRRRRFDPLLLLLHITFLIGSSLYYHSTHRNSRFYPYPYSRPYIGPAFSLFYHFGETHVDATHAR